MVLASHLCKSLTRWAKKRPSFSTGMSRRPLSFEALDYIRLFSAFYSCSVDPYLFENFNTVDGDFLTAKFRAFKFPESTYVQFRGTVNVCLDKCQGVRETNFFLLQFFWDLQKLKFQIECANGQTGYGRRRRAIKSAPADPNKVYEISLATFIKVNYEPHADPSKNKAGHTCI